MAPHFLVIQFLSLGTDMIEFSVSNWMKCALLFLFIWALRMFKKFQKDSITLMFYIDWLVFVILKLMCKYTLRLQIKIFR